MPQKKKVTNHHDERITQLVAWLADPLGRNWTRVSSDRDSSDEVLAKMAELGIIGHERHPLGGNVWIVDGRRFGRTSDDRL
jgi:hypothetical protein